MATTPAKKPPMIFISYRREDTGGDAGWLNDTLQQLLGPGRTFFDFDQIAPGVDFQAELQRALGACAVLLALIGPRWERVQDANGQLRLSQPGDLVRLEVLEGLNSPNVRVVPVLLNRDQIPSEADLPEVLRPLIRLNAFAIRRDRWHDDVTALLKKLGFAPQAGPASGDNDASRQARRVSATVEWKRKDTPDPAPRRWVVYIDNASDAPITVEKVIVSSASLEMPIEDWEPVRPNVRSDYELEESDFDPRGERPEVFIRFRDSLGQRWSLRRGVLKRMA